MMPHVSLIYAGVMGLFVTLLGANVSRVRMALNLYVSTDAPPRKLFVAQRAHANATEWVPLLLILLLVVEMAGGSHLWLHIAGGTIIIARVLHAIGLMTKIPTSVVGATATYGLGIWLPIWALMLVLK